MGALDSLLSGMDEGALAYILKMAQEQKGEPK